MIHPTAIVETDTPLPADTDVGPYAIIQGAVELGSGCRIDGHAQLLGRITLGSECIVGPGAILGGDPQDLNFDSSTDSGIIAGDRNVFREHSTVHRSSTAGGATCIGEGNFFMAGAHVGHDSRIGDRNIVANDCLIGGHVTIGNRAFLGGGSAYHQQIRVGDLVMVQGNASITKDLPPYTLAYRVNEVMGLNRVGLLRAGLSPAVRREIHDAFSLCYREGLNLSQTLEAAGKREWESPEARNFFDFLRAPSAKGAALRLATRR